MNYQKMYNDLIEMAKNRVLPMIDENGDTIYKEAHHIMPRAFQKIEGCEIDFPIENWEDTVNLLLKEHRFAHLLLAKIYKGTKYHLQAIRGGYFVAVKIMPGKSKGNSFVWIRKQYKDALLTFNYKEAEYIWSRVWGEDRNEALYTSLEEELPHVAPGGIRAIARNAHCVFKFATDEEYKKLLRNWHEKYGYYKHIYIIRSPGNDLLPFYDYWNKRRSQKKRLTLSPSKIFEIRFRWPDSHKNLQDIREYCNSLGIRQMDNNAYWHIVERACSWLVDAPYQEWRFESFPEVSQWIYDFQGREVPKDVFYNGKRAASLKNGDPTGTVGQRFFVMNEPIVWYGSPNGVNTNKGYNRTTAGPGRCAGLAGYSFITESK